MTKKKKGLAKTVDQIPMGEITISILRTRYPRRLFAAIRKEGIAIDNPFPGIYMLRGIISIPLQVIYSERQKYFVFHYIASGWMHTDLQRNVLLRNANPAR